MRYAFGPVWPKGPGTMLDIAGGRLALSGSRVGAFKIFRFQTGQENPKVANGVDLHPKNGSDQNPTGPEANPKVANGSDLPQK